MFYPGTATACARLIEVHERKVVIGQGLFDGEGHCTAVQKVIMVSLNEETHRSTPFDPACGPRWRRSPPRRMDCRL